MKYNYRNKWRLENKLVGLPKIMKRLLIDNSSLTKRLSIKKGFITVLSTKLDLIKQSEHSSKKYTLVRKVQFTGILDYPVIATSYTPVSSIKGRLMNIKYLKGKSLATVLFKKPKFKKQYIDYLVTDSDVRRYTSFQRNKLSVNVEEIFPKNNNYPNLRLIECRRNISNF